MMVLWVGRSLDPNLLVSVQGTDEEKAAAVAVLVTILELVRVVAVMLLPVTPSLAGKIYSQLGFTEAQFQVCPSGPAACVRV